MSYATLDDLERRIAPQTLVELADDDGDGAADAEVIAAALADADAAIDSYLAARYATPLTSPPAILTRLAADIAVHALFARKRSVLSPEQDWRHETAIKTLQAIQEGRVLLVGVAPRDLPDSTRRGEEKTFAAEAVEGL